MGWDRGDRGFRGEPPAKDAERPTITLAPRDRHSRQVLLERYIRFGAGANLAIAIIRCDPKADSSSPSALPIGPAESPFVPHDARFVPPLARFAPDGFPSQENGLRPVA